MPIEPYTDADRLRELGSRNESLLCSIQEKEKALAELQEAYQELRLEHEHWLWEFNNVHAPVFRRNIERITVLQGQLDELRASLDGKVSR